MRSHIHHHDYEHDDHLGAWFWGTLLAVVLFIASAAHGWGHLLA